jgi:hypothetical protein
MYSQIVAHRREYGSNWISILPDGSEIPWRQLTLQEFIDYNNLLVANQYTLADIEDEVFAKAVLDPFYVENIDLLLAGTISAVVYQIMLVSGTTEPGQLQNDLNQARHLVNNFFDEAVVHICTVFPAYTPEEVFALNYDVFIKRLAQAERKLLSIGFITEPLQIFGPEDTPVQQTAPVEKPSERKKREYFEERQRRMEERTADLNSSTQQSIPQSNRSSGTVITKSQMSRTAEGSHTGHDLMDKGLWEHDARQGLEHIYPEYFKLMKEGKKITPETIQEVKGKTNKEVEEKHEKYIEQVISGEIKPQPSKFLIADKLEGQSQSQSTKTKVKVKRR